MNWSIVHESCYILILLFILMICILNRQHDEQISKNYYTVNEVCPELMNIYSVIGEIKKEVIDVNNDIWTDWPEKELYDNKNIKQSEREYKWNIYPFTAFGVVVEDNCKRCPHLWNFIQHIPGVKAALLSRLGPGTKLNPHRGWGRHSNHVIRCHFGIDVPRGCYVAVKENENDNEDIKLHKEGEWMAFDDSRIHYAHNPTNKDRIVLIIDVQRPKHIKTGNSDVGDTKELKQIVNYFKQKNIIVNKNKPKSQGQKDSD